MTIERLRAVIAEAEALSDQQQEVLAAAWAAVLEELEEQEWDALLSKPGSSARLKQLVAEGRKEHAAGETEEITGDKLG